MPCPQTARGPGDAGRPLEQAQASRALRGMDEKRGRRPKNQDSQPPTKSAEETEARRRTQ